MAQCSIIPKIKTPKGDVESNLFKDLYEGLKIPRAKALEIYYKVRESNFMVKNGNWIGARVAWIKGEYNSIEKAKEAYGVTIATNNLGEPTVESISDVLKDFGYVTPTTIKPGVEELFESNPELANAVYEALGFEQVYHGSKTTEKYSEYKIPVNKGVDSLGSFFTSDLDGALIFTPDFIDESSIAKDLKERTGKVTYKKDRSYVKKEYLKLQNSYTVDIRKWEDNSWINDFVKGDFSIYNFNEVPLEIVDRVKKILIDRGYDGIYIAKDFYVGNMESRYDQYIVFDPNKTLKQQKQQALQLYSQYLDTIFPDSQVKDIVYHGTSGFPFEKFSKEFIAKSKNAITSLEKGFYFTNNKKLSKLTAREFLDDSVIVDGKYEFGVDIFTNYTFKSEAEISKIVGYDVFLKKYKIETIQDYLKKTYPDKDYKLEYYKPTPGFNKGIASVVLNIKEPTVKNLKGERILDAIPTEKEYRKIIEESDNSIIFENVVDTTRGTKEEYLGNTYVVFEPEQIHILGGKQDIEGFKKFTKSESPVVNINDTIPSTSTVYDIVEQYPEITNYLNKIEAENLSRLINESYSKNDVTAVITDLFNGRYKVNLTNNQGQKYNISSLSTSPKVDTIIRRLAEKLPGITVMSMTYAEAQAKYNGKLPPNSTSMIDGSTVILFSDRVTEETAIEEMLHPFVLGIAKQNPELFENLLKEASRLYPELAASISREYKSRGQTTVNLEIVTQALSKVVNKEYEQNDTRVVEEAKGFFRKFLDLLSDWFNSIINDPDIYISPSFLESNLTLGDVAILLNTEGLQFTQEFTDKIFYNLTANTAYANQVLDYEAKMGQEIPKEMRATIDKLFVDSSFVKYDPLTETYSDTTGNPYTRISDFIKKFVYKGVLDFFGFDGNEDEYSHNREWGNQIDGLFESVLEGSSEEDAISKWKTTSDFSVAAISENVARKLYKDFVKLKEEEFKNVILIPQVIMFNREKQIAGRADIVAVYPDGSIKVLDLKSSITSTTRFEYAKEYTTSKGPRASKKLRHAAQLSGYKGLFLSQGYEFNKDDLAIIPAFISDVDAQNNASKVELESEIEVNGVQDIVAALDEDKEYKGKIFADNKEAVGKAKSIIDKVLKTLAQRKLTLERQPSIKASSFKKKEIQDLERMIKDAQYIKSLSRFIDDAYSLFISKKVGDNDFPGLAYEIRKKIKTLRQEKDKLKVIDELNYYRKMVESYMPIMNEIRDFYQREIGFNENVIENSELDKIRKIVDAQQTVLTVYNNEILPEIANVLAESASQSANVAGAVQYESIVKTRDELLKKGHKKRAAYLTSIINKMEARNVTSKGVTADIILENLREGSDIDIPLLDLWLNPAISSSNSIVALFAKTLKEKFEAARIKLIKFRSVGVKAFKDFKAVQSGSDNPANFNKPFYEVIKRTYTNDKGEKITKQTAKFVQPYDEQAYINAKGQFKQSIEKLPFADRRTAWRDWYNKNHETLPEEDEVVINPYTNEKVITQKGRKTLMLEAIKKKDDGIWTEYDFNMWLSSVQSKNSDGSVEYKNEFTRPSRRVYPSAKYNAIQNNKAYKKYYDYLIASYFNAQNTRVPENSRLGYTLPSISKNANDRLREQGLKKTITRETKRTFKVVEEDVELFGESIEGEKIVPLLFHQPMDADNVSLDLISSVMRFEDATLKYEAQSSLAGLGDATLQTLKQNAPFKRDSLGNRYIDEAAEKAGIKDSLIKYRKKYSGNNIAALFEAFLDMQVYGQMKIPHPMMFNMDANKLADALMGFTSKVQIGGLNIVGNIANSMTNHISLNIEAAGKQWFSQKDLVWAKYFYNRYAGSLIKDFSEPENKSFLGQLVDLYDPMQGEFRDKYGRKVSHSVFKKLWSMDTWFFMMHQTDYSIQVQMLLAHLKKTKVKRTVNGKTEEISLFDAYEMGSNGKIKLKEGVEIPNLRDENGLVDFDTMNKVHAINKRVFGVYNKFDEVNLGRYWYGRMVIMYKKHVAPGFKRRFKGISRDEELGDITEGYHNTFLRLALTDTKRMVKALYSEDSGLSPVDRANLKKSVRDMMWVMATGILVMVLANLYSAADDDDEKTAYKYALFFALRLNQDLGIYGTLGDPQNLGLPNIRETLKLVKNPVVALAVIERGIDMVSQLKDPFATYKNPSGIFDKGDSKLGAAVIRFAGISGTSFDPGNAIKFMQQNK